MRTFAPLFVLCLLGFACTNQNADSTDIIHVPPVSQVSQDLQPEVSAETEPLSEVEEWEAAETDFEEWEAEDEHPEVWEHTAETFERDSILSRLSTKVENGETLFVHLFVPLCDNENQGIVPVPARIGNGQDPRSNLYWGAGYGVRNFFDKKKQAWKLIAESKVPEEPKILERLLFYRKFNSGAEVCLVADAYDGAEMETCIREFLQSLAGKKVNHWDLPDSETMSGVSIAMHGNADLMILNGHNGLMDTSVELIKNEDGREKDAMVIACASYGYFEPYLDAAGGYPLLTTTNLLAPEAYVVEAAISDWARLKSGPDVHHAAGVAYNTYQKCGLRGAKNTFQTGWD